MDKSREAFQACQIHPGRESCSRGDGPNPQQSDGDAHFILRIMLRSEREGDRSAAFVYRLHWPRLYEGVDDICLKVEYWNLAPAGSYEPSSLSSAFAAKGSKGDTDTLVDRVRGDAQPRRNLFRCKMLMDKQ